ncbi:MAG: DNA topoisomerase IB [Thermomicrobiales bacterium]
MRRDEPVPQTANVASTLHTQEQVNQHPAIAAGNIRSERGNPFFRSRMTRSRIFMEPVAIADPENAAKEAGLSYAHVDRPGITRRRAGKGFSYRDAHGNRITDVKTLGRIRALVIPPAWEDVWICTRANGHIQATGRDTRGRKQYRYHEKWREVRDESKYERMLAFGQALPEIRDRIDRDMRQQGLPRTKVIATVVKLLEATLIRVGNERYARENKSFGLTTMRTRHVDVTSTTVTFNFKGKSGIEHEVRLKDRRLASLVKRLQDLPGQELFQYRDDGDHLQTIDSGNVNAYLREITGDDFTAKDFRTWAGTVLAAQALAAFEEFDSESSAKANIVNAVESVSARLGNTRTVCRKCYVHPAVIDAYLEGETVDTIRQRADREIADSLNELPPEEAAVLMLLRERLA